MEALGEIRSEPMHLGTLQLREERIQVGRHDIGATVDGQVDKLGELIGGGLGRSSGAGEPRSCASDLTVSASGLKRRSSLGDADPALSGKGAVGIASRHS